MISCDLNVLCPIKAIVFNELIEILKLNPGLSSVAYYFLHFIFCSSSYCFVVSKLQTICFYIINNKVFLLLFYGFIEINAALNDIGDRGHTTVNLCSQFLCIVIFLYSDSFISVQALNSVYLIIQKSIDF
jgi:hypothetical protein